METALRRIECGIANVADVDVAKQWVGLTHSLQGPDRDQPQHYCQRQPPPARETECETAGDHNRNENQLSVTSKKLIGTIGGLMNDDLARLLGVVH
jgi:hypothetical protein